MVLMTYETHEICDLYAASGKWRGIWGNRGDAFRPSGMRNLVADLTGQRISVHNVAR